MDTTTEQDQDTEYNPTFSFTVTPENRAAQERAAEAASDAFWEANDAYYALKDQWRAGKVSDEDEIAAFKGVRELQAIERRAWATLQIMDEYLTLWARRPRLHPSTSVGSDGVPIAWPWAWVDKAVEFDRMYSALLAR